jgi:hypothetical protein
MKVTYRCFIRCNFYLASDEMRDQLKTVVNKAVVAYFNVLS